VVVVAVVVVVVVEVHFLARVASAGDDVPLYPFCRFGFIFWLPGDPTKLDFLS
jgi:hypothetical protein